MPSIDAAALSDYVRRMLIAAGSPESDADCVAEHLVAANLKGHDSHGVGMAPGYMQSVKGGLTKPGIEPVTEQETETTAVIDGGWNFGQVVAKHAMAMAMDKARRAGVGIVVAHSSSHAGRIGTYAEQAAAENLIGVAMVNNHGGGHSVTPFGGVERRLSTNPMAFGFPTSDAKKPFVLDMATSMVASGKLRIAFNKGEQVPDNWLLDASGKPTNDPATFYEEGGTLLPVGVSAGYKGFGLAMVVEGLAGALTAAGTSRPNTVSSTTAANRSGNGIFTMAMDPECFGGLEGFTTAFTGLIDWVKQPPFAEGIDEILTAGEPERHSQSERNVDGIPVDDTTWQQLTDAAKSVGVEPPIT